MHEIQGLRDRTYPVSSTGTIRNDILCNSMLTAIHEIGDSRVMCLATVLQCTMP